MKSRTGQKKMSEKNEKELKFEKGMVLLKKKKKKVGVSTVI